MTHSFLFKTMGIGLLTFSFALVSHRTSAAELFIDCSTNPNRCETFRETDASFLTTEFVDAGAYRTSTDPMALSQPADGTFFESSEQFVETTTTIEPTKTETKTTRTIVPSPEAISEEKISIGDDINDWDAKMGETLRSLLLAWGADSGWTVIWKLDRDYLLEAGVVFRGNFMEVASALIRSFARANPAPIGTFYKGNRVLVISTQEDENAH